MNLAYQDDIKGRRRACEDMPALQFSAGGGGRPKTTGPPEADEALVAGIGMPALQFKLL